MEAADDARKKRVSDHVASPVVASKEKLKKLKGGERSKVATKTEDHEDEDQDEEVKEDSPRNRRGDADVESSSKEERRQRSPRHEGELDDVVAKSSSKTGGDSTSSSSRSSSNPSSVSGSAAEMTTTCDLESALQRVARMGSSSASSSDDDPATMRERALLKEGDDDSWIKYRVAHSGDAATLATCYRKRKGDAAGADSLESPKENSPLEVWLAEGLGDEDEPPFVFALLAEIYSPGAPVRVGSAALLTQTWSEGKRYIRVEWTYSMNDHLERSMWLRLASLGLMCSCDLLVGEAARCETKKARHV